MAYNSCAYLIVVSETLHLAGSQMIAEVGVMIEAIMHWRSPRGKGCRVLTSNSEYCLPKGSGLLCWWGRRRGH